MPKLHELAVPPIEARSNQVMPRHFVENPVPPYFHPGSGMNPFLRCPMPVIRPVSPDSLRQFYRDGTAQTRIISS